VTEGQLGNLGEQVRVPQVVGLMVRVRHGVVRPGDLLAVDSHERVSFVVYACVL